jgi:hypothetical protein
MMAVDEALSTGPCGVQDQGPFGVGDTVRRNILVLGIAEYLKKVLCGVREFHPDWFREEIGVERDHVHLAHGDSAEIRGCTSGGTLEKPDQWQLKGNARTGCAERSGMVVGAGHGIFRLDGESNEATTCAMAIIDLENLRGHES